MIDIGLPKLIGYGLLILVIIAVPSYAMHERRRAVAAEGRADALAASLLVMQANARSVRHLEAEASERTRKRKTVLDFVENEVRHVPSKPVTPSCKKVCADWYAPIHAALGGLRRLREARSSTAADAAVR